MYPFPSDDLLCSKLKNGETCLIFRACISEDTLKGLRRTEWSKGRIILTGSWISMPSGTDKPQNSHDPFLQKRHLEAGGIPGHSCCTHLNRPSRHPGGYFRCCPPSIPILKPAALRFFTTDCAQPPPRVPVFQRRMKRSPYITLISL